MTFQLCALPMIICAACSATTRTLTGMLIGRFIVGIGLDIGSPVASLYITEVSPHSVYGTYGSLIQISTCLGLTGTLSMGNPVKSIPGCQENNWNLPCLHFDRLSLFCF